MTAHLVFGARGISTTAKSFTWDPPDKVSKLLSVLEALEILELDSAASYPPGNAWNTEMLLGQSKAPEKRFIIDSKVEHSAPGPKLDDKGISASVDHTLKLLGMEKVWTMYAHGPDPETPLEKTAAAFHKHFMAGKFEQLGLCKFSAADVAKYFTICEEKGYVKPTVYQGHYNALYRAHEKDLIPLLRQHNCAYYAFTVLV